MGMQFKTHGYWGCSLKSKPHYFFYYYVPKRYDGLSYESYCVRHGVWNFKVGRDQGYFIDQIERKIRHTFDNPSLLTLVCIPASTRASNSARYEWFSNELCARLNMANGFNHITIFKEKTPSHLGGQDSAVYSFDINFFKGKKVILFDDVVTRGRSMNSFIDYLGEIGAEVVCCMSIGKTFWDRYIDYRVNNPWTGVPVFNCGYPCAPDVDNYEILVNPATPNAAPAASSANVPAVAEVATPNTVIQVEEPQDAAQTSVEDPIFNDVPAEQQIESKYKIGDRVRFGKLNDKAIQWIVLDQKQDEYLLISKFGLDCRAFNTEDTYTTWDTSSLRTWLNKDFYKSSFNNSEQAKIIRHTVVASDNPIYRTAQGKNTEDKLFILSVNEYNYYFDIYNKWVCRLFSGILRQCWLRNSGADNGRAAFIGRSGSIHAGGSKITSARNAVRPVMWVKL